MSIRLDDVYLQEEINAYLYETNKYAYLAGNNSINSGIHGISTAKLAEEYFEALCRLNDVIGGYNFSITECGSDEVPLLLSVDKERTATLADNRNFRIWQVTYDEH